MADRKISDLTALTTPATGDLLPIVDVSEAAAADKNKSITVQELFKGVPDGTAAAPGLAFESDDGNGIYKPGTDQLALATNGTGRLFVDSSGNVGIGTSPLLGHQLTVNGSNLSRICLQTTALGQTGTDGFALEMDSSGTYFTNRENTPLTFYTNNTERLRITSDGKVGVGTSSPSNQLTVQGASGQLRVSNGTDTADLGTSGSTVYLGSNTNVPLYFYTNNTTRMYITSGGNVGVGTTSPSHKLVVSQNNSGGIAAIHLPEDESTILGSNANTNIRMGGNMTISAGGVLGLNTNGSERARITSDGKLGVGTSTITEKLTLICNNDTSSVDNGLGIYRSTGDDKITINAQGGAARFVADGGSSYIPYRITQYNGTTLREAVHIDSSGNVGIGTTSPNVPLTLESDSTASFAIRAASDTTLRLHLGYDYTNDYARIGSEDVGINQKDLFQHAMNHRWGRNNSIEYMRLDSEGRLLVGTTSDSSNATLVLQGSPLSGTTATPVLKFVRNFTPASGNSIAALAFHNLSGGQGAEITVAADANWTNGSSHPTRLVFSTTADGASYPTERMRIHSAGTVYTFTSSQGNYFASDKSAGTTYTLLRGVYGATNTQNGTASFQVWTNGNVVNLNNSYGSLSDIKLKENIVDASSQWDDLKALQVRNYNFKEGPTHTQIGVVAQEVEIVSPGLVTESPDFDAEGNDLGTTTKSVNYSVLYMKAVKALQEAMERIEVLEAKVNALEGN